MEKLILNDTYEVYREYLVVLHYFVFNNGDLHRKVVLVWNPYTKLFYCKIMYIG